jgi:hypothetical protein
MAWALSSLFLVLLFMGPAAGREPRRDPQTGKIRLKYIGDCLAAQTPTRGMQLDPLISLNLIPSSIQEWAVELKDIRRYMRLYMPRNLEHLVGETDVVMISNSAADYFRPDWLQWISTATQDGLGLVMIGGLASFGGFNGYIVYPDWGETAIGVILPVETLRVSENGAYDFAFKLIPSMEDDPLMSAFDWKTGPHFFAINRATMKPGASRIAVSDPEERPLLAYQQVERGSVLAFLSTWGSPWGNEFVRWEYFVDFSADMGYYSAGLEIPDPVIVHEIRMLFEEYQLSQEIVRSIMDFVDRLGGRMTRVQDKMDGLVLRRSGADDLYIQQEYAECKDEMASLIEEMKPISEQAMRAKDSAFLWIYVIEWSSVTATVFLSGYFLYWTMIRRRLFRQAGYTRAL